MNPDEVAVVRAAEKEGWSALRSLQGDKTFDRVRRTRVGANPRRGVAGTISDALLEDVPVLAGEVSAEYAERLGVEYARGQIVLEAYGGEDVVETDLVRYGGRMYAIVRLWRDGDVGQLTIVARPSPESGS